MSKNKVTLRDLSRILATPYEELRVTASGEEICHETNDDWGGRLLRDDDIMLYYDVMPVEKVDCYYDGDHMVLDIELW